MTLCYVFRSFVIILIIELAVESQVHAFSLQRFENITPAKDNVAANSDIDEKVTLIDINSTEDNKQFTTIQQDATNKNINAETSSSISTSNTNGDNINKLATSISNIGALDVVTTDVSSESSAIENVSINSTVSPPEILGTSSSIAQPITNSSTSNISKSDSTTSAVDVDNTVTIETRYSTESVTTAEPTKTDASSSPIDVNSHPPIDITTNTTQSELEHLTSERTKQELTEATTITRNFEENPGVTASTLPYWKKYTEIDRKRTTYATQDTVSNKESDEALEKAESTQTRSAGLSKYPRLENVLSKTSEMSALGTLKNEPLSLSSNLPTSDLSNAETSSTDYARTVLTEEPDISASPLQTSRESSRMDVLRAGYLDYSFRPTQAPENATSENNSLAFSTDAKTEISLDENLETTKSKISTLFDKTTTLKGDSEILSTSGPQFQIINVDVIKDQKTVNTTEDGKLTISSEGTTINIAKIITTVEPATTRKLPEKVSGLASQSQLTEDALNEELMKEQLINDKMENSKIHEVERLEVKSVKDQTNASIKDQNSDSIKDKTNVIPNEKETQDEIIVPSEDKLRVQPILSEKKNSSIYTINPNYKPLKKIDVQPPKPFLRDPDDNSWRNESLSTLGIVFKAKNSSKPFTQVLKNKTEMQLNSVLENKKNDEQTELRTRLEKIAEERKSKKKKIDSSGNTVYTDYEDSSIEREQPSTSTPKKSAFEDFITKFSQEFTGISPEYSITGDPEIVKLNVTVIDLDVYEPKNRKTSDKPKKVSGEEYDGDDDDVEYVSLPNIDLKKSVIPLPTQVFTPPAPVQRPVIEPQTTRTYPVDRKPTLQYFPPRERAKVTVNEYDDTFKGKVNEYMKDAPKYTAEKYPPPVRQTTTTEKYPAPVQQRPHPTTANTFGARNMVPEQRQNTILRQPDLDKNLYVPHPLNNERNGYTNHEVYERPSYVIKHLRDFMDEAAHDDDTAPAYITEVPARGVTANAPERTNKVKPPSDYYDYDAQFRRDILDRFVENFNQNSERFKVDFPILYNTSVVHSRLPDDGKAYASSSAFMKRLYENSQELSRKFDPNCDRNIELSPAYELHYYVPGEEEKQMQDADEHLKTLAMR